MSDNPMQDIDAELSAVTRSFGAAATMLIRSTPRTGSSAAGRRGVPRQTLAPSARRIRAMSTGKLTRYMWKTHLRGASGINVSAETRRISSELQARGLVGVNQQWRELASSHTHHNHVQPGSGYNAGQGDGQRTRQQSVPQQVSHQWATPQIAAAVAGLGVGASAMVGDQLAEAIDAHLVTLGLDGLYGLDGADHLDNNDAEPATDTAETASSAQDGIDSTLAETPADVPGSELRDGSTVSDSPTLTADEDPQVAGDETAHEQTGQTHGADITGDLVAVGAVAEAVEASDFGSSAIAGEIGQALADETGGDGLSTTPEAEQATSPEQTPQPAAAEPGA